MEKNAKDITDEVVNIADEDNGVTMFDELLAQELQYWLTDRTKRDGDEEIEDDDIFTPFWQLEKDFDCKWELTFFICLFI